MNYPVWEHAVTGGGLLVAVIAVVHVYIAHFAVGGGFFLVTTEWMGYRRNQPGVVAYVRSYARFFLLVTMVLGAMTGVGIWFSISLLAPAVTSILIHRFVFAWAAEWVFFAAEIIALFLYWYRFDRMTRRDHLIIGGCYVLFAWLSLFMVNGVITVMLTPGNWPATLDFWDGFFNPSMWPSLGYRTGIAVMFAGIFGFVTALFSRERRPPILINWCVLWTVGGFVLSCPFLFWYFHSLQPAQQAMIVSRSPELFAAGYLLRISLVLILIGLAVLMIRVRGAFGRATAVIVVLAGLGYMGGFEWLREGARRPWLIVGHTYASGIAADQAADITARGLLASARWVDPETRGTTGTAAGHALFTFQCAACHSVGGPVNDILPLTRTFTVAGMDAQLSGQGLHSAYMPPFMGTAAEREALARYIVQTLNGRQGQRAPAVIPSEAVPIPPFDARTGTHVLLAASARGIYAFSPAPDIWSLHGPARATIRAQLIRRGETPAMVMDDVFLSVRVPRGQGIAGPMRFSDAHLAWEATVTALSPVDRHGRYRPYPLVDITARKNAAVVARTRIVLPQTTEWGCGDCHGGSAEATFPGMARIAARNILAAHDRRSRTDLGRQADEGDPVVCAVCHAADAPAPDRPLNLSAAIHAFHAVYLNDRTDGACSACHASNADGATRFFRGIHHGIGLACENCHGDISSLATGLLMAASEHDKPAAQRMLPWLADTAAGPAPADGRRPWINLPDCLGCHVDFEPPDTDVLPPGALSPSAAARFNAGSDDAGILCTGCHGSPHALYPADNPYGRDRDDIVPLQFQGTPYPVGANGGCRVCHTIDMTDSIHHFAASAMFRNTR